MYSCAIAPGGDHGSQEVTARQNSGGRGLMRNVWALVSASARKSWRWDCAVSDEARAGQACVPCGAQCEEESSKRRARFTVNRQAQRVRCSG